MISDLGCFWEMARGFVGANPELYVCRCLNEIEMLVYCVTVFQYIDCAPKSLCTISSCLYEGVWCLLKESFCATTYIS
jgi:hypothetical protein